MRILALLSIALFCPLCASADTRVSIKNGHTSVYTSSNRQGSESVKVKAKKVYISNRKPRRSVVKVGDFISVTPGQVRVGNIVNIRKFSSNRR